MQGVRIDLISEERLAQMPSMEKIRLILDNVREGTIVILESGLTPDEQSVLIEMTMQEILPDGFSGIEIESYQNIHSWEIFFYLFLVIHTESLFLVYDKKPQILESYIF